MKLSVTILKIEAPRGDATFLWDLDHLKNLFPRLKKITERKKKNMIVMLGKKTIYFCYFLVALYLSFTLVLHPSFVEC